MSLAQRRWTREIAACETNVRRRMMEEDQCRDRLRRTVLRGAYSRLKHVAMSTDLLSSSQEGMSQRVSAAQFQAYGITPQQVTPFSVYVMTRLLANPSKVDGSVGFSFNALIADYQTGWTVLSPQARAQYETLCKQLQTSLLRVPFTAQTTRVMSCKKLPRRRGKGGDELVEDVARRRLLPSPHVHHVAPNTASNTESHSVEADTTSATAAQQVSHRQPCRRLKESGSHTTLKKATHKHTLLGTFHKLLEKTDAVRNMKVASWERQAFECFLCTSYAQMKESVGSHVIRKRTKETLTPKKWMPIALSEWGIMTPQQKKLYAPRRQTMAKGGMAVFSCLRCGYMYEFLVSNAYARKITLRQDHCPRCDGLSTFRFMSVSGMVGQIPGKPIGVPGPSYATLYWRKKQDGKSAMAPLDAYGTIQSEELFVTTSLFLSMPLHFFCFYFVGGGRIPQHGKVVRTVTLDKEEYQCCKAFLEPCCSGPISVVTVRQNGGSSGYAVSLHADRVVIFWMLSRIASTTLDTYGRTYVSVDQLKRMHLEDVANRVNKIQERRTEQDLKSCLNSSDAGRGCRWPGDSLPARRDITDTAYLSLPIGHVETKSRARRDEATKRLMFGFFYMGDHRCPRVTWSLSKLQRQATRLRFLPLYGSISPDFCGGLCGQLASGIVALEQSQGRGKLCDSPRTIQIQSFVKAGFPRKKSASQSTARAVLGQ
eukprot:gene9979-6963_t